MENLNAFYSKENDNLKVWGFDLGKGSFGYAVRFGLDFLDVQSLLLDADFAETKTAASNRSLCRLRKGHIAREMWLEKCLKECGIEVLKRRKVGLIDGKWQLIQKGDVRLEKEFPSEGEDVCYCGIALRCKLILGEKLESWQVFKALNSAIQNRGYDKEVPWKEGGDSKSKKENESEYEKNLALFERQFDELLLNLENLEARSKYEYPCFFKAAKMGLWNPKNPEEVLTRIDNHSEKAKGYVVPCECVEKEFIKLVEMATLQYPKLAGKSKYFLYGPSETKYASYCPNLRKQFNLKRGADTDWQGALGQKIPRFDNRVVDKCRLIPRLNVCKIKPLEKIKNNDDLLYYEIVTAFKLLNLRFFRNRNIESLNFNEFMELFAIAKQNKYKVGARDMQKFMKKIGAEILDENQSKIESPKESGRASFSRPAMKILHGLIFSGKSPAEYYEECLQKISNENPQKGLVKDDLLFLKALGNVEWNSIYIPDVENFKLADFSVQKREDEINKLIGSQNDPIVRHRLFFFYSQLKRLEAKFGIPDKIVIEFVRDDFLGEKRKKDLHIAMKKRREEKLKNAKDMDNLHPEYKGNKLLLKWELFRKQKGICIYTGEALQPTEVPNLEIEHIVPRSRGGPDAMYNYVLTKESTNKEKGDRTPFEWLSSNPINWASYVDRVRKLQYELGAKRCKLLVEKDAETLVEKYTALAETAWISKLAQRIACLHFGFQYAGNKGDKKVFTVSGGMTSRIRSAYKLNRILREDWSTEEAVKILDELKSKLNAKENIEDRENTLRKISELKSKIEETGFLRKYVDQIEDFEKEILSNEERLKKLEEFDQKNRKNNKHHALDAMCLCFAPTGKDARKVKLDRIFPQSIKNSAEEFFRKYLDAIIPNNVVVKKPSLEETFYSKKERNGKIYIERKYNLKDLAYTGLNPKYNLGTLEKLIKEDKIVNKYIRNIVRDFVKTSPSEFEWINWCENLRLPSKFGTGTRVKRVLVKVGKPDEYKDLSKDGTGAYKRGKTHKGQIVWKDSKGKYKVAPIYAHSSKIQVVQELKKHGDFADICGVFKSGCLVKFDDDVKNDKNEILLKKGVYTLNTIRSDGFCKLADSNCVSGNPIGINNLMNAGMKRIKLD